MNKTRRVLNKQGTVIYASTWGSCTFKNRKVHLPKQSTACAHRSQTTHKYNWLTFVQYSWNLLTIKYEFPETCSRGHALASGILISSHTRNMNTEHNHPFSTFCQNSGRFIVVPRIPFHEIIQSGLNVRLQTQTSIVCGNTAPRNAKKHIIFRC